MRVRDIQHKSEQRVESNYSSTLGIQSYGVDNLYPQMLRQIINGSPTGMGCLRRYARFIEGNGFKDIATSELVVNRKGETLDDLHALIASDLATFGGFAIHVGYNVFGQVAELHFVPFEMCRLSEPDADGYVSKVVLHPDWTGRETRNGKRVTIKKENCEYIDVYNPKRNVVNAQIEAVGGVEYYKGQVLYYSCNGKGTYPIGRADGVITEMSTDEGLANVKYRNVRNNFLPSGMMITKRGQGSPNPPSPYANDAFDDTLLHFQGDTNACKMIQIEVETDEDKPDFVPFNTANYDKEYSVTETSVTERIYSAYGQEPWYCIRIGKVGFSGDVTADAFEVYNSEVNPEQRLIERTFNEVMRYWYDPTIPRDLSIEPLIYRTNGTSTATE